VGGANRWRGCHVTLQHPHPLPTRPALISRGPSHLLSPLPPLPLHITPSTPSTTIIRMNFSDNLEPLPAYTEDLGDLWDYLTPSSDDGLDFSSQTLLASSSVTEAQHEIPCWMDFMNCDAICDALGSRAGGASSLRPFLGERLLIPGRRASE